MSANNTFFIHAPGVTARQIAEEALRAFGVTESQLARAKFCTAATESHHFDIPKDADYHGYLPEQGLPVWARVLTITPDYLWRAKEDYGSVRGGLQAYQEATHLVRMTHSSGAANQLLVQSAAAQLREKHWVAWMDQNGALSMDGPQ
ncbi:hypothetical protein BKG82_27695 [Mycobacteroides chelonae]|uniref:Uncharacterized protein n=1 Tax=Mycobacteroides chelonae TaxID=1774 RepID=A0A1S1LLB3_MYCCH|nr:hypothetical protein [Mycobacteroides chelonae]OHU47394.1 hypothetical protein BKG82_27695 [Mycobacteroides chelonae]